MPRWIKQVDSDPEMNLTTDFLISELLNIKQGKIRIGLDFSNSVSQKLSATINLGTPSNEMIALRGLIFPSRVFILYDWIRVLSPGGLLWIDSLFCLKEDAKPPNNTNAKAEFFLVSDSVGLSNLLGFLLESLLKDQCFIRSNR
ncbi:hypothetical protein SADUNF_Sadunf14G0063700 [Salix dunnii]|uniref:Methyltransferase type 11 domain-containing protein n=1 Tax=Salix dunnii TaxID=1413687 RepID=A0A835JD64_9ROSI|nr:hypothetical protein SADUNF_Sadunf14G0063700 [Salix dunnii]